VKGRSRVPRPPIKMTAFFMWGIRT